MIKALKEAKSEPQSVPEKAPSAEPERRLDTTNGGSSSIVEEINNSVVGSIVGSIGVSSSLERNYQNVLWLEEVERKGLIKGPPAEELNLTLLQPSARSPWLTCSGRRRFAPPAGNEFQ